MAEIHASTPHPEPALDPATTSKQAENIHNLKLPLLLPGITITTGPNDHAPVEQAQLSKFDGKKWALFGEVLGGAKGG